MTAAAKPLREVTLRMSSAMGKTECMPQLAAPNPGSPLSAAKPLRQTMPNVAA